MKSIKKTIRIGIAAGAMICLGAVGQTSVLDASAHNPIVQTSFTPDPAPVVFGDELWVFTGCDKDAANSNYTMIGWQAFSTKDMQNWTDHGMILKDTDFSWCNANDAWASQCIERNGKYYFYFTTTNQSGGGRAIGVAVADNPEGPYKDVGQAWLMFGNPTCYYVKLKEDMVTLDGQIKEFPMTTEAFGPGQKNGCGYGEGPWIYKHKDLYYLVYACFYGSDGGESQAYATAPTVTGPWKFGNQIQKQSNCFTTHGGIIDYKDHSYLFYHKNGLKGGGTFNRSASCEEFTFNPDGSIGLSSISEWKYESGKVFVRLTQGQNALNLAKEGATGTLLVKGDSGYYIVHLKTVAVTVLEYSAETAGQLDQYYSDAANAMNEYDIEFVISAIEQTSMLMF